MFLLGLFMLLSQKVQKDSSRNRPAKGVFMKTLKIKDCKQHIYPYVSMSGLLETREESFPLILKNIYVVGDSLYGASVGLTNCTQHASTTP